MADQDWLSKRLGEVERELERFENAGKKHGLRVFVMNSRTFR